MNFELPKQIRRSSPANPLCALEDLLSQRGINLLLEKFKPTDDDFKEANTVFDSDNELNISRLQDEFGEWHEETKRFSEYLKRVISRQYDIAKNNIDEAIFATHSKQQKESRLATIVGDLRYIQREIVKLGIATKYRFADRSISDLIEYIFDKYGSFANEPNSSDIVVEELTTSNTHPLGSNQTIIEEIFNHLSGETSFGEVIMSAEEYNRLIGDILYLVRENKVPENIRPYHVLGISAASLKYTFYLLHRKIYPPGRIMDAFINFLKEAFPTLFDNWQFSTLKTKFSVKPGRYPF